MSILDLLLGKPLASDEARAECIGTTAGIPIFGLDALSSAAYGPEAALTLLLPLGAMGVAYMVPISTAIIILLAIVYFSYRQTIAAYPGGGGSYTVARQNLGVGAGLLAAAALMIDYVLAAIAIGLFKTFASAGHPTPIEALPKSLAATAAPSAWLIMQAFASGCTAMTGVEAVSNGVKAFREPVVDTARRTLTVIIALLIVMLAGIAYLVHAYGIQATDPGQPGYQSVLSMLLAAVAGRGVFYYISIGSILAVLTLSANTA